MILLNSIRNNIKLFSIHFNIWLFKFLIIYFSFEPVRFFLSQFFEGKTINQSLFTNSDSSALFEVIWQIINVHGNPLFEIVFIIILIALLMLVLDSLIDCGFIAVYATADKTFFWKSLKENANRMILLKIILIIPYLFITLFSVIIYTQFFNPISYQFPLGTFNLIPSLILISVIISFALFVIRGVDYAKISLILNKRTVSASLISGFQNMFSSSKQIISINSLTVLIFVVGIYIYSLVNQSLNINSSSMIWIMTIFFQLVIFLKQVLRFSYTGAVIDFDFKSKKNGPIDANKLAATE